MTEIVRLPGRCVVVLVGPSASGKTVWARRHFRAEHIVSSDALRALVGEGEHDQRASVDAFELLDAALERRLARGLLTVIDTLGIDPERRRAYLDLARRHQMPCFVVAFDTPARECKERNRARARPVPAKVLDRQLRRFREQRASLEAEGFDGVLAPGRVVLVPPQFMGAAAGGGGDGGSLRFGLDIPAFDWEGGSQAIAAELRRVAEVAEQAGFESLWVMDHFIQIPQVGREWDPMLESQSTLGFLAAATRVARLGTLVTGITYRNVALLGKTVATLDVLSGGRMVCGLGAGWFQREHDAYGFDFPPAKTRLDLVEDALQMLPLLWGPGSASFAGKAITVPDTFCYPRPLQEKLPILVGGSGEKRTLRLVATYADACNLIGDAATVRHKLEVLGRHCADVGRDPTEIEVTQLGPVLTAPDPGGLERLVEDHRPASVPAARYAEQANAAVVSDQIGRFRLLADAGVGTAIVALPPVPTVAAIERFAPVIEAFR